MNTVKKIIAKITKSNCQDGQDRFDAKLNKIEQQYRSARLKKNKKILFTHSFSIYSPCFAHDKLMAFALGLRGCEIFSTYCDGVQSVECGVYGGVWTEGRSFQNNCLNCQKKSKKLWSFLDDDKIIRYSQYINKNDINEVDNMIESIDHGKWIEFSDGEFELGRYARDIVTNNYTVGHYTMVENHEYLGRVQLKNLILCKLANERIIEFVNPDRIISNDSYYGMWKIWELLAKKNRIPFYSHWSGTSQGRWCYAYNDASMKLDFSRSWQNYCKEPLLNTDKNKVLEWLDNRMNNGGDMIFNTASLNHFKNDEYDFSKIDVNKPTALLCANVVWDLAALNKEVFNSGMFDWMVCTIEWFAKHSEYQLIIKPHPAELDPLIPETQERVEHALQRLSSIPKNVFILSPKVNTTVYNLFDLASVGLVFTTSVGMEMAAKGIPVITAGKSHYRGYGFTIDPKSKQEYYMSLGQALSKNPVINRVSIEDLAIKFIKFNFFHYFTKTNIIDFKIGGKVNINVSDLQELSKGNNAPLDYILDCIINGHEILQKNKWPEATFNN